MQASGSDSSLHALSPPPSARISARNPKLPPLPLGRQSLQLGPPLSPTAASQAHSVLHKTPLASSRSGLPSSSVRNKEEEQPQTAALPQLSDRMLNSETQNQPSPIEQLGILAVPESIASVPPKTSGMAKVPNLALGTQGSLTQVSAAASHA